MKVRDIMTTNVASTSPDSTVYEAAELMHKHNIGSIPVTNGKEVIGIVTDRDIVLRNIVDGRDPKSTSVREIMTTNVLTVRPETDVPEATRLMSEQKVRRLPVVENDALVGMISLGDVASDYRFDTEASEALSEISEPARPENMSKDANRKTWLNNNE